MATLPERKVYHVPSKSGFRATLNGIGVADLIQMNCLSGQTMSVKVSSTAKVGWLHFANGALVHASVGHVVGDDAVLEILAWQEGNFEPTEGVVPERHSVVTTWQNLLLLAAQRQDEGSRTTVLPSDPLTQPRSARVPKQPLLSVPPPPRDIVEQERISDRQRVKVDEHGNITFKQGNVGELVAQAAYAAELALMIADGLGLERALGLELRESNLTTLVRIGDHGELDVHRGPNAVDFSEIRRDIGL
jgi:hypothetical protein